MNQGMAKQSSEYNSIYESIINTLVPKDEGFNQVVASSNFYDQYSLTKEVIASLVGSCRKILEL
jgi:hypothetical protein